MQAIAKNAPYRPVLKVKTAVRAGYYLGLIVSAGGGPGIASSDVASTPAAAVAG